MSDPTKAPTAEATAPGTTAVAATVVTAPTASVQLAQPARPLATPSLGIWATESNFALAQRAAIALAKSEVVPQAYRGKPENCLVALDIANHQGVSPLMVMQNLNIIHGRPSWGSSYVIAALNSCGRFSPLRFRIERRGKKSAELTVWTGPKGNRKPSVSTVEIDDTECVAYATDLASGERIDGPPVSIEMAVLEGWTAKAESKWATMPELMLRYRAAAFFGRLFAPDILMGMQTVEEVIDVADRPAKTTATARQSEGAAALQEAIEKVKDAPESEPRGAAEGTAAGAPAAEADPGPMPEPSDYTRRALAKDVAGEALSKQELDAIDEYQLELDDWRAKGGKAE